MGQSTEPSIAAGITKGEKHNVPSDERTPQHLYPASGWDLINPLDLDSAADTQEIERMGERAHLTKSVQAEKSSILYRSNPWVLQQFSCKGKIKGWKGNPDIIRDLKDKKNFLNEQAWNIVSWRCCTFS